MKRIGTMLGVVLVGLLAVWPARAADSVEPATCTITNKRSEAESGISGTYFKGCSLLFTNCQLYASTTTNTVQGLDGVTVLATISDGTTSTSVVASAISEAGGTYWFKVANLSTNFSNQGNVQIKVTDGGGSSYIYPWKALNMRAPL